MKEITKTKMFTDAELELLTRVAKAHEEFFEKIRDRLPEGNVGKFIFYVLGDFLHDMNEVVLNNPEAEISYTWDGKMEDYIKTLYLEMKYAKNIVVNLYLDFVRNADDLIYVEPDVINDFSDDYYYGDFGGAIDDDYDKKEVNQLTDNQFSYLNDILLMVDLDKITDDELIEQP